ncbi:hypothetical protein K474DRAFT_1115401 [Panus rudis PR-1116 ss-1]|nr:hypothetical protein K474DRAFT_1115401 [Panus rudis PR-1116 ss-1]
MGFCSEAVSTRSPIANNKRIQSPDCRAEYQTQRIKEHVASGGSMSGALGVLAPLCPTLVANALQAAVQSSSGDEDAELAKLIHEYLETRDTIQRMTYKLHHLEQSITEIETLQSSLELTVQELSDLSKRLSAITNVWPMLRADLEFISQLLPFAGTSDFDKFFQLHLRTLTSIYTVIAAALRQYQIAVNPEDPSFKNAKKSSASPVQVVSVQRGSNCEVI